METLNVGGTPGDPRSARLSNFSPDSFRLDGIFCASVEGFIQGVKWPEGDAKRTTAFGSVGGKAKRCGKGAERKWVWWQGSQISFGSQAHHALIERAIRAKFEQNRSALMLLVDTRGLTLIHDLGHPVDPQTSLPGAVFCAILTRIRDGK